MVVPNHALESSSEETIMATRERLGIGFLGAPAVPEMVKAAKRAEELGYESIWVSETRFTRDGFAPVAAIAAATHTVKVATGIVNVYTRGPVVMAISFASLDEISEGRTIMGLGPGSPLVLAPQGVPFTKPITRLREYIQVIERLLAGESVTFQGETIQLQGVKLELTPVRRHIPLYLGITGPKALELTGEVADGAMLNGFTSAAYTRRAVQMIARGAQKAGKAPGAIDIAGCLVTCVDNDSRHAKDQVRPLAALYLSLFPNVAQEAELPEDFVLKVRATYNSEGLAAATPLIGDQVVDHLTVAGTAEECKARIAQYRAAGMAVPLLFPIESNTLTAIEALAP